MNLIQKMDNPLSLFTFSPPISGATSHSCFRNFANDDVILPIKAASVPSAN